MVSKSQIKFIKGLQQKKCRNIEKMFFVEGKKVISEFLNSSFVLQNIYTTDTNLFLDYENKVELITEGELKKISALKTPNKSLAVFKQLDAKAIDFSKLILGLDDVRDPGNLGTIIRLCDWFGITDLICSENTVDVYNPKVIQATMGSLSRVNVVYGSIKDLVGIHNIDTYGAFMDGDNVHKTVLPSKGMLIMGNESNGISEGVSKVITKKITIPKFGAQLTESLNVATATAILLNEFKRGD